MARAMALLVLVAHMVAGEVRCRDYVTATLIERAFRATAHTYTMRSCVRWVVRAFSNN